MNSLNLGNLVLHFAADIASLEQSLNAARAASLRAAVDIESGFKQRVGNGLRVKPTVDHSELYALNKHLDVKKQHHQALQRYFNANKLSPKVDHKPLVELNKHLDLKEQHHRRLQRYFASNPLRVETVYVDSSRGGSSGGTRQVIVEERYSSSSPTRTNAPGKQKNESFCDAIESQTDEVKSAIADAADSIVDSIKQGFKSNKKGIIGEALSGILMGAAFTGGQKLYEKAEGSVKSTAQQQQTSRQAYRELSVKTKAAQARDKRTVKTKETNSETEQLRQEMMQLPVKQTIRPLAQQMGVKGKTKRELVDGILQAGSVADIRAKLPYIDTVKEKAAQVSKQAGKLTSEQLKTQLSQTIKGLNSSFKSIKGTANQAALTDLGNQIEQQYQSVLGLLSENLEDDMKGVLEGAKLQIAKTRKAVSKESQKVAQQQAQGTQQKGQQQGQYLRRAKQGQYDPNYSPIYQAREALLRGAAGLGQGIGRIKNAPNYAIEQLSNENLSKQADSLANKARGNYLGFADYWNIAPEDTSGVEGLKDSLAAIAQLVQDISEPDIVKANLKPLISDFQTLTKSIKDYKLAIEEKGTGRFLTEDLISETSNYPGIRTVVTEGLKRRNKRKSASAAEKIKAEYDPSQSDEYDSDADGHIFAASGFHEMEGQGSEDFAEKLRIATSGQNFQVHPIINKNSDLATAAQSTENLKRNVLRGDVNPDDVEMARKAYAAWKKNPKAKISLAGYSGGGYNVQGAGLILDQLGVPYTGVGIGTPNLNITRDIGKNYQAIGLDRDRLITEEVDRAKQAGFDAGPDQEFKGRTHAVQHYLGTAGKSVVEHLTGTAPEDNRNRRDYDASEYVTQGKALREWLEKLRKLDTEGKLSASDAPVIGEGIEAYIEKYESLPWDKLSSELRKRYSPHAQAMAGDLEQLAELMHEVAQKPEEVQSSAEEEDSTPLSPKNVPINSPIANLFANLRGKNSITKGLSKDQIQRLQKNYQNYFKEVAKVYNVENIVDVNKLPSLKVDPQLLEQHAAEALYDIENNQIIVSKELQQALASSTQDMMGQYSEVLESLTHEIQHALTLDFGELSLGDVGLGLSPVKLKGYHEVSKYAQGQAFAALDQGSADMSIPEAKGMLAAELNAYDSEQYTPQILENLVAQSTYESVFDNEGFKKEQEEFKKAIVDLEKLFTEGLNKLTASLTTFAKGIQKKLSEVVTGFLGGNRTSKDGTSGGRVRFATLNTEQGKNGVRYVARARIPRPVYQPTDIPDPWEDATPRRADVVMGTTGTTRNDPRGIGQRARVRLRQPLRNTAQSAQAATQQAIESFNKRLDNYVQQNYKEVLAEVSKLANIDFDETSAPNLVVNEAELAKTGQEAIYDAQKHQVVITRQLRDLLQTNPEALEQFSKKLKPLVAAARAAAGSATQEEAQQFSDRSGEVLARVSARAKGKRSNYAPGFKQAAGGVDAGIDSLAVASKEFDKFRRRAYLYARSLQRAARTPEGTADLPFVPSTSKGVGLKGLIRGDIQGFFGSANSMQSMRLAMFGRSQQPFGANPAQGESSWERIYNRVVPLKQRAQMEERGKQARAAYKANANLPQNAFQTVDFLQNKFQIPIELYAKLQIKGITDVVEDLQKYVGKGLDSLQQKAAALPYFGDAAAKAVGGLKLFNIAGVGAAVSALRFLGVVTKVGALMALAAQVALVTTQFDTLRRTFTLTANEGARSSAAFDRIMSSASRIRVDKTAAATGATQIFGNLNSRTGGKFSEQVTNTAMQTARIYSGSPQQTEQIFNAFGQLTENSVLGLNDFEQLMNALPGSFDIAARSMGMTNAEFQNFLKTSSLLAEDFLPRFIQQMNIENQPRLGEAMNGMAASTDRYNNALLDLQLSVGKVLQPMENIRLNALATGLEMGAKAAELFAKWIASMAAMSIFKFLGSLKNVGAALLPFIFNINTLKAVFLALKTLLGNILPIIAKMGREFLIFHVAFEILFTVMPKLFNSAGGKFKEWADGSVANLERYQQAVAKAADSNKDFLSSMPQSDKDVKGQSVLEDTIAGFVLGKENVRGAEQGVQKFFGMRTFAEKQQEDSIIETRRMQDAGGQLVQGVLGMRVGKDGTKGALKQFSDIESKLEDVRMRRRAVASNKPQDITELRKLREEERGLLGEKERVGEPITQLQSALAAQIKTYQDALAEYEDKAGKGEITQQNYLEVTTSLRASLLEAEKAQGFLNKQIQDSTSSLLALQQRMASLSAELADNNSNLAKSNNELLTGINIAEATGYATQGQAGFARMQAEQDMLAQRLELNQRAAIEMRESLAAAGGEDVLAAYKVDYSTTGAEQFGLLSRRAESQGNAKEQEIFANYQKIKEMELETSDLQQQLSQRAADMRSQLTQLTSQVNDYYRGVERTAMELAIATKQASIQMAVQSQSNRLKVALLGIQDNIISQFAESILEAAGKLGEASSAALDAQEKILQNSFNFQDISRQGVDIQRQLPGKIPAIPVQIDLSGIKNDPNLGKLDSQIKDAVDSTRDLKSAQNSHKDAVSDTKSAISSTKTEIDANSSALQGNKDKVAEVKNEVNANTQAVALTGSAVTSVSTELDKQPAKVKAATDETSIWQKSLHENLIPTINGKDGIAGAFDSLIDKIGSVMTKSWEWIKGLADNVPFLQSIGSTISGWGQAIADSGIGQAMGGAMNSAGNAMNTAGSWIGDRANDAKNAFGDFSNWIKNPMRTGGFKIQESVGSQMQNVYRYEDLEKHHPSSGIEPGRNYRKVDGRLEEVRGDLIKKDFVLSKNGNQAVDVPSPTAGYARVNKNYGQVALYDRPDGGNMLGQVLHLDPKTFKVKSGDFVQYGQALGNQGGAGIGGKRTYAIHTHVELPKAQFQKYIQDLKDGVFEAMTPAPGQAVQRMMPAQPVQQTQRAAIPQGGRIPKGGGIRSAERVKSDPAGAQAIVAAAQRLGLNPVEFTALMSWESGGTFNPNVMGGDGNRYKGMIQFSPDNQRKYGTGGQQSIPQQIVAVEQYLKDRGFKPGQMDIRHAYSAVLAGNASEKYWNAKDSNGTNVRNASPKFQKGDHYNNAMAFLQASGVNPNQPQSAMASPVPMQQQQPQIPASIVAPVPFGSAAAPVMSPEQMQRRTSQAQQQASANNQQQNALALQQAQQQQTAQITDALSQGERSLRELQKGLRESGIRTRDISDSVIDAVAEGGGVPQTIEQQQQKRKREVEKQFRDLEQQVEEQLRDVRARKESAEKIMGTGGIITEEIRGTAQNLLKSGNLPPDLAKQLQESLTTGVFGDATKQLLQTSIAQADGEGKTLNDALAKIKTGKETALKNINENFERQERIRKQQAGFGQEEADLSVLEAEINRLKELQQRSPFDPSVAALPALEATVAAKREELDLEQKIAQVEEKKFNKELTEDEANKQIDAHKKRLGIVKETITANKQYTEAVLGREKATRDREANLEAQQGELAVMQQQLAALQQLAQIDPSNPEVDKISELSEIIELKQAELDLVQKIAAAEQARFEGKRTAEETTALIAQYKQEYELNTKNAGARRKQADAERSIQKARFAFDKESQTADIFGQISEGLAVQAEYGQSQNDPLRMRLGVKQWQQELSLKGKLIELQEMQAAGKITAQEVDNLTAAYQRLDGITLENLKTEYERSVQDRDLQVRSRLTESSAGLMEARASGLSQKGLGLMASDLNKDAAVIRQNQNYQQQTVELERFIQTNQIAGEQAAQLRGELEQLNSVQLGNIQDQYSPWTTVLSDMTGGFKTFFSGILSGTTSLKDAFNGLVDSILGSLANLAAEWVTNELFGNLFGSKKQGSASFMIGSMAGQEPQNNIVPFNLSGNKSGIFGEFSPGASPMMPMYVSDVGRGLGGGLDMFGAGAAGAGDWGFGSTPLPVDMVSANSGVFDPLANTIGSFATSLFSGGGLDIGSAIGGLFGGGGGGDIFGSLMGMAGSFFGFNAGGKVGEDGEATQFRNFAKGGNVAAALSTAIQKEKALNGGRRVVPAVLTAGERVLTVEQNRRFEALGGERILNFASGGVVGEPGAMSASVANRTAGSVTVNSSVNVNTSSGGEGIRADEFQRVHEAMTLDLIRKHSKNGGLLHRR